MGTYRYPRGLDLAHRQQYEIDFEISSAATLVYSVTTELSPLSLGHAHCLLAASSPGFDDWPHSKAKQPTPSEKSRIHPLLMSRKLKCSPSVMQRAGCYKPALYLCFSAPSANQDLCSYLHRKLSRVQHSTGTVDQDMPSIAIHLRLLGGTCVQAGRHEKHAVDRIPDGAIHHGTPDQNQQYHKDNCHP